MVKRSGQTEPRDLREGEKLIRRTRPDDVANSPTPVGTVLSFTSGTWRVLESGMWIEEDDESSVAWAIVRRATADEAAASPIRQGLSASARA